MCTCVRMPTDTYYSEKSQTKPRVCLPNLWSLFLPGEPVKTTTTTKEINHQHTNSRYCFTWQKGCYSMQMLLKIFPMHTDMYSLITCRHCKCSRVKSMCQFSAQLEKSCDTTFYIRDTNTDMSGINKITFRNVSRLEENWAILQLIEIFYLKKLRDLSKKNCQSKKQDKQIKCIQAEHVAEHAGRLIGKAKLTKHENKQSSLSGRTAISYKLPT